MMVYDINKRDRCVINNVHKNQDMVICKLSVTEMDIHDDINRFGEMFSPILFMFEFCTVSILLT